MHFLTDFADQDVAEPTACIGRLVLLGLGWWRGAAAWAATIVATFGTMLVLKLGFQACSTAALHPLFYSSSGHTLAGAVIYGGLLALSGIGTAASLLAALTIAGAVGWSRLALGLHSLPEVLIGGGLGVASVPALRHLAGPVPPRLQLWSLRRGGLLAAIVLVPAAMLHGRHSTIELRIRQISQADVGPMLGCAAR